MCTVHNGIAGICPSQHTNVVPSWHARTITAFSTILMTYAAYWPEERNPKPPLTADLLL
jgi:hypothetical protein